MHDGREVSIQLERLIGTFPVCRQKLNVTHYNFVGKVFQKYLCYGVKECTIVQPAMAMMLVCTLHSVQEKKGFLFH